MSEGTERATVRVTIFGEEYAIRTDAPEEYTLECARYVDDAVQQAHVRGQVAEPHRAAVLAALQITDELFRTRRQLTEGSEEMLARVSALRERVGAVVPKD
ncbi:MAG: cell division protein ZapA [Candidatus Palauibacterales bacterium]|jgi:cell division protein ZapA|nr:cell division protein ZapA [Candidatus Palauibacterales bacterium]MDP2482076.1 cell division protein ZapA [Candidatus Palauibacterales bacterium]